MFSITAPAEDEEFVRLVSALDAGGSKIENHFEVVDEKKLTRRSVTSWSLYSKEEGGDVGTHLSSLLDRLRNLDQAELRVLVARYGSSLSVRVWFVNSAPSFYVPPEDVTYLSALRASLDVDIDLWSRERTLGAST